MGKFIIKETNGTSSPCTIMETDTIDDAIKEIYSYSRQKGFNNYSWDTLKTISEAIKQRGYYAFGYSSREMSVEEKE